MRPRLECKTPHGFCIHIATLVLFADSFLLVSRGTCFEVWARERVSGCALYSIDQKNHIYIASFIWFTLHSSPCHWRSLCSFYSVFAIGACVCYCAGLYRPFFFFFFRAGQEIITLCRPKQAGEPLAWSMCALRAMQHGLWLFGFINNYCGLCGFPLCFVMYVYIWACLFCLGVWVQCACVRATGAAAEHFSPKHLVYGPVYLLK